MAVRERAMRALALSRPISRFANIVPSAAMLDEMGPIQFVGTSSMSPSNARRVTEREEGAR
jgi:hypothetical protein